MRRVFHIIIITIQLESQRIHIFTHFLFGLLRIREYDRTFNDLPGLMANVSTVLLPSKYAYSGGVSFAIHKTVFHFFFFAFSRLVYYWLAIYN